MAIGEIMPSRQKMTGWYDPVRLVSVGIRVAEATVFGKMFDRRELIASLDPFDRSDFDANFDFSSPSHFAPDGNFWLDFCADTGDGWRSTHAVAGLLARSELRPAQSPQGESPTGPLLQGRVLVFGGDEVYPTASKEDYEAKLRAPFADANQREAGVRKWHDRFLFALPGNHDWYDDLTAFAHLFCNRHPSRTGSAASPGRNVCGRETRQTRSYFALKLPHNWWLCAWDVQLDGYVDQTQISFFEYVAQEIMEDGSNVILCVGQPVWAYCQDGAIPEFLNFAFAALIVSGGFPRLDGGKPTRHHNVRLVLTGDTHHYSHFVEHGTDPNVLVHYLACGQGGAFLHPTHWLTDTKVEVEWKAAQPLVQTPIGTSPDGASLYRREFQVERDERTDRESVNAVFPDRKTSAAMTWRNLRFAAINPQFALFVAGLATFSAWLLHFGSLVLHTTLADLGALPIGRAIRAFLQLLLVTPWPVLVIMGIGAAFIYFADRKNWPKRILIGGGHALLHILAFLIILFVLARHLPGALGNDFWIVVLTGALCGLVNPTIFGAYLLTALNACGFHWNEAFSSLRIEDYKGFLRLKIDQLGNLTVYPIVVERVPRSDDGELLPRLVEKPIELRATAQPTIAPV
jgi:hypothetical protein